ncbi:MAG: response regulator [Rhodospirillaceae bacterium]|nr:response regulator [Rhodospirillaceae bacterium]
MSRSNPTKSPRFALTWSYLASLALVALLFAGANILVARTSDDQRKFAQAAHVTDRLIMVCQRVAWLSERYAGTGDPGAHRQLQQAISETAIAADNLRTGKIDPQISLAAPPEVLRVYAEHRLSDHMRTFVNQARALAFGELSQDEPAGLPLQQTPALQQTLAAIAAEADGPLLAALNAVGQAYLLRSSEEAARLETYQRVSLIVIILTLGVEALFIFRPLVNDVATHVEDMLEHTRKASAARRAAQQANAAKTTFLSNMSHELRTPMAGIMGICELLLSTPQPPEQAKMTRMLKRSAQTLLELLNDILDLAKIEAGQMVLETIDFDPAALLEDVRNLFEPSMAEKGLGFCVDASGLNGAIVRGDPKRLRQVLCNLTGNALKFTEKGEVGLKAWIAGDEGALHLKFAVADSGVGISEEGLTRLFRKFEQEERSTARRYGGTGLGLAICKQLSEAMGGGIDVQSRKGTGSTFTVHVRVERGDPEAVAELNDKSPARAGDRLGGLRLDILLAEDNATLRFIVSRMLNAWGQTLVAVSDGRSAVQEAAARKFDIILLDMQMPIMDGDKAAREIRASGANTQTPIIALTADGIAEHHPQYLAAGCNAVLTKPVDWEELAEEIRLRAGMDPGAGPGAGPAPPVTPAPVDVGAALNPAALDSLQDILSKEEFEDLLRQFRDSLSARSTQLTAQVQAGDLAQVRRTAHALKGLCAQMGADGIAAIAEEIEIQCKDMDAVNDLLPRLEDGLREVLAALDDEAGHAA